MYKRVLITGLMIVALFMTLSMPVFADPPGAGVMQGVNNVQGVNKLNQAGNQIVGIVTTVGILISVGVLMIIGIKYMLASPENKASLKSRLVPYAIGAVITFAAANIVSIIYNLSKEVK